LNALARDGQGRNLRVCEMIAITLKFLAFPADEYHV
jgi:hypothetical protein